eukprot:8431046-Pyramimonas_sp.AAC.1
MALGGLRYVSGSPRLPVSSCAPRSLAYPSSQRRSLWPPCAPWAGDSSSVSRTSTLRRRGARLVLECLFVT